jgi:hypothetical protein
MGFEKTARLTHVCLALLALAGGCRNRPAAQNDAPLEDAPAPRDPPPVVTPSPTASAAELPAAPWVPIAKGVAYARTERVDGKGRNTVWVVLRIVLGEADVAVITPPHARLEQLPKNPTIVAAVNGGFFEADGSASGLLVSHGRRMGKLDARGGSGVLILSQGLARLVAADGDVASMKGDVVLQCGPRLVEPDGTIGIRADDGKRASRTAACIRAAGRELDLVLAWTRNGDRDGPGLFELAQWLRQPIVAGEASGCDAALNLDGGPSTGIVMRGMPDELHKPYGRVPWAIAVTDGR